MPVGTGLNFSLGPSNAQRVLTIPELLDLIFSFQKRTYLAQNVLVCKIWSEVAMDSLWRTVDDLPRLFRLLGPIEACAQGHRFSKPLEPSNWTRFMRYASRVRILKATAAIDTELKGPLVFDEIAQTRTSLNIFSRLSDLTWVSEKGERLRLSLLFMNENIKRLAVLLRQSENYTFTVFFQEIKLRMPQLTVLDLRFTFSVKEIEEDLCQLFEALPKLRTVIMPQFTLTNKIIEALSRNPVVGTIQFEFIPDQGSGNVDDISPWKPILSDGAFPALYDLSLSVELPDMLRFLHVRLFPANLKILYVHALHVTSAPIVRDFLADVASSCKRLRELHLDFNGCPHPYVYSSTPAPDMRLTWDTIRPVLKCAKLTSFDLHWDAPLALSQKDIEELAASWPDIEDLKLNPAPPPYPDEDLLSLQALLPFARHCPNLRELGLYMAVKAADAHFGELDADIAEGAALPQFKRLKRLYVGFSSLGEADAEPVALFLSRLLPAGCLVASAIHWSDMLHLTQAVTVADAQLSMKLLQTVMEQSDHWDHVERTLPLLIRLRAEERARRAALETEVEDLRIQCRLLEERLGMGVGVNMDGCVLL